MTLPFTDARPREGSRHPIFRFNPMSLLSNAGDQQRTADLMRPLIASIWADRGGSVFRTAILEAMSGGRSGARVFKVTPLAARHGAPRGTPVIVKICAIAEALREKANYEAFVERELPATCRPRLLGFSVGEERAALCYSYVGNRERPQTLSDRLAAGDLTALDRLLPLFELLGCSWYAPQRQATGTHIAGYYLGRYFADVEPAAGEAVLLSDAVRFFKAQADAQGYRIGRRLFPALCSTLFERRAGASYRSCILHGDLNSDNVILGDGTIPQLVDFQRVGRGPASLDIASLEASIRINYPLNGTFSEILELERRIALADLDCRSIPYGHAILCLRDQLCKLFGREAAGASYHYAVAAIGLRLMRAHDLTDAARARVVASALWAAKMLAKS